MMQNSQFVFVGTCFFMLAESSVFDLDCSTKGLFEKSGIMQKKKTKIKMG